MKHRISTHPLTSNLNRVHPSNDPFEELEPPHLSAEKVGSSKNAAVSLHYPADRATYKSSPRQVNSPSLIACSLVFKKNILRKPSTMSHYCRGICPCDECPSVWPRRWCVFLVSWELISYSPVLRPAYMPSKTVGLKLRHRIEGSISGTKARRRK